MAISLIPSPSTARAGSLLVQGVECVGGWQIRHGDLGCYRVLRFPKCKEQQVGRKFIAKLILALNRNLTIEQQAKYVLPVSVEDTPEHLCRFQTLQLKKPGSLRV